MFSYQANAEDADANGFIPDEEFEDYETGMAAEPASQYETKHNQEKLDEFMVDYNAIYKTNYSVADFYGYYQDLSKRVKNKEVDILLVVNMFLTGFDSKMLNTIYVRR